MTQVPVYAVTAALLIAIGLYGFTTRRHLLRQLLAVNVMSSGVFVLFGALARRAPGQDADPVPHAMIITGIVVAMAATALAVALVTRLHERTGAAVLPEAGDEEDG